MLALKKYKEKIYHRISTLNGYQTIYADDEIQQGLSAYFATNDFRDRFSKLIQGLDSESIKRLTLIIGRLQYLYTNKKNYIDTLSKEEQEHLSYINNIVQNSIISLNEQCWFFNGFYFPEKPLEIGVLLDHHGISNFEDLDRIKHGNIIDVGGFIGDSAIIFSQYTNKCVYSFEMNESNFKTLQKTIAMNNLSHKIIAINKGLGSKKQEVYFEPNGNASKITTTQSEKSLTAQTITLDSFVQEHNIHVSLIKVDIEGFEMDFIKGALETIKTQKPSMIISIYHNIDDFFNIKPFIESLDLGYRFKIFKPIDYAVSNELCLFCEYDWKNQ